MRTVRLCLEDEAGAEKLQSSVYRFLEKKSEQADGADLFTAVSLTPSVAGYTAEVRFEAPALAREFERHWRAYSRS